MDNILTCDGTVMCADCFMRNTSDCDKYQDELTAAGSGDDYGPNFWDASAATPAPATKLARIERIPSETQGRRGSNPHYAVNVLDARGIR